MLRGDESPGDGELDVAPDVGGALAGGAADLPPGLEIQTLELSDSDNLPDMRTV